MTKCEHHECRCARAEELCAMGMTAEAIEVHEQRVTCRRTQKPARTVHHALDFQLTACAPAEMSPTDEWASDWNLVTCDRCLVKRPPMPTSKPDEPKPDLNSAIVEKVAETMHSSRDLTGSPTWERLPESRRNGYRSTVREVLLAMMSSGYLLRDLPLPSPPPDGPDSEPSL